MNDAWNSDDIDQAKAELTAAGWVAKTSTLWKSPSGSLHVGTAGAWKTMKRSQNDEATGIIAMQRATFESENAAAEARIAASERLVSVTVQRDLLRSALAAFVGVDGRAELEELEAVMRLMPAPAQDKAATIDAIHALIATLPATPARPDAPTQET